MLITRNMFGIYFVMNDISFLLAVHTEVIRQLIPFYRKNAHDYWLWAVRNRTKLIGIWELSWHHDDYDNKNDAGGADKANEEHRLQVMNNYNISEVTRLWMLAFCPVTFLNMTSPWRDNIDSHDGGLHFITFVIPVSAESTPLG